MPVHLSLQPSEDKPQLFWIFWIRPSTPSHNVPGRNCRNHLFYDDETWRRLKIPALASTLEVGAKNVFGNGVFL